MFTVNTAVPGVSSSKKSFFKLASKESKYNGGGGGGGMFIGQRLRAVSTNRPIFQDSTYKLQRL